MAAYGVVTSYPDHVLETVHTGVLLLVFGLVAWVSLYLVYRIYTGPR